MALSKQSILKHAGVFKTREVHVPAWADESGDDVVLVRGMTIREYEINATSAPEGLATATVIARCVLDESGARVFDPKNVSELNQIAELPLAQIRLLDRAITEESGMADGPDKAVADAAGNSVPTPSDDSVSD